MAVYMLPAIHRHLPSAPELGFAIPTVEEARAIPLIADPVLRNLKITHSYHQLASAFRELLDSDNASWVAYAAWASRTAGRFIRSELPLPAPLRQVDEEVARRVSHGNTIVYAELGPLFADFLQRLSRGKPDARTMESFFAQFTPGPMRPGRPEEGGQDMLIEAFRLYFEAISEPRAQERAEMMLLANVLIGYHEQIRLQDTIAAALRAPWTALMDAPDSPWRHFDRAARELLTGSLIEPWMKRAKQQLRRLLTRTFLTYELGGHTLRISHDVPPLDARHDFPPELQQLRRPRLRALLNQLDRTPDTLAGSAAQDWSDLADRMNFIVDVFRSRQRDPGMLKSPFPYHQLAAIEDDRIPDSLVPALRAA